MISKLLINQSLTASTAPAAGFGIFIAGGIVIGGSRNAPPI
jgi:hypothetical protein